jgi:hypothetical protein
MSTSGGTWSMTSTSNGTTMRLRSKGRIEVAGDDTDVTFVEPGGYFILETGGTWVPWASASRFEVQAKSDGTMTRGYSIKGRDVGEAEGRRWLATELPTIVREYAIGAAMRVTRLLATGGPSAVLKYAADTSSDFAKRTYLSELLAQGRLDSRMLATTLRQAGNTISSDFELANVLKTAAARYTLDAVSAPAYAEATATIESDFELHHALRQALRQAGLDDSQAVLLVRAAVPGQGRRGISSDFEQASLLVEVPPSVVNGISGVYFEAVNSVQSDFERRRVLTSVASRPDVRPDVLAGAVEAAGRMHSDFERAEFFVALASNPRLDARSRQAAVAAAQAIGSDFERGRALSALRPPGQAATTR